MLGWDDSARHPVDRLIEISDSEFEKTDYDWDQFLNYWETNFTLDVTGQAKASRMWIPSDKQQAYIRTIVDKLEFRLNEIREYNL